MIPPGSILRHLTDVHVHPTDSPVDLDTMNSLDISICAMSTHPGDQNLVRALAEQYPDKVTPCFGIHPWWSHQIAVNPITSKESHYRSLFLPSSDIQETEFNKLLALLPDPTPLTEVLTTLRSNLQSCDTAMLGEVGLDRIYRVPYSYTAEPRVLTSFTIPIEHQIAVLEAMIEIAIQMRRNISMHSVKAQQHTVDLFERLKRQHGEAFTQISLDMHSCGLSVESWKVIEKAHPNVYLSLSTVINSRSNNHKALIAACSPTRLLVESDYNDIRKSEAMTWSMVLTIAQVRGWTVETEDTWGLEGEEWGVVRWLESNWKDFRAAKHSTSTKEKKGPKAK